MFRLVAPVFTLFLVACASTGADVQPASPSSNPSNMEKQIGQAIISPLTDLNIVRADIPKVLADARKAPYARLGNEACPALRTEVETLDALLGPDLDTPASSLDPSLIERGVGAAGEAAIGALRSTTEAIIPFRGWVRKLTGAERYSKEVAASIAAGTVRRAFLKGLGHGAGCTATLALKD